MINLWQREKDDPFLFSRIYAQSAKEIAETWLNLSPRLRENAEVRAIFAIALTRMGDHCTAKRLIPELFDFDGSGLLNFKISHFLSRIIVRLYLKRRGLLYKSLARLVCLFSRNVSEEILLVNMYQVMWTNNTIALQYLLPLFCRELLRNKNADSYRHIWYFGYLCALNLIMDDGIQLMVQGMSDFKRDYTDFPSTFWLHEGNLMLSMAYYYAGRFSEAEKTHLLIENTMANPCDYLFISTINYATWLRLSFTESKRDLFFNIVDKLKYLLGTEYDNRFALRTHSFRALLASIENNVSDCSRELAIADSLCDQNPWGLEYCNHLGIKSRIFLAQGMAEKSFEFANLYNAHLLKISPRSSFVIEANNLMLKSIIACHLLLPRPLKIALRLGRHEKAAVRESRKITKDSQYWAGLFKYLLKTLRLVKSRNSSVLFQHLRSIPEVYSIHFKEIRLAFERQYSQNTTLNSFSADVSKSAISLRYNRQLCIYIEDLTKEPLSSFINKKIADLSLPLFSIIFEQAKFSNEPGPIKMEEYLEIRPCIWEAESTGHFQLVIKISAENTTMLFGVLGYRESLRFRLDKLEPILVWQKITESKLLEKINHQRIIEQQRASAIAKTTQTIAHDLRTPINVIQSALDSNNWDDFSKQKINFNSAMFRLRSMVDSFRRADFESVVKPGWGEIEWERLANEMGVIAIKSGTVLHIDNPNEGPVYVDVPKIERVVMNLIKNAIEAGAKNVWIATETAGIDLAIEISDDGPGVPEEFIPKLFGRGNSHNKQDGTGLGLNFVRETANGHGGEATYTRDGCRSLFRVTLPGAVKSEEKSAVKKEVKVEEMKQDPKQLTRINGESLVINGNTEKFTKVTLCLSSKDLEVRIIAAVSNKFPTIEIGSSLENSSFLWASDHMAIKDAIARKVPIQIVSADDSLEKISETICNKLKYYI